jgi:hypothetical protein
MSQREERLPVITGRPAVVPAPRRAAEPGAPASASVCQGGPELAAVVFVDGLDGAERKVLLHHIAQAYPDVVDAGVGLVAQWRAECAEHRRKNLRRRDHDKRRRRAAEAGGD